MDIDLVKNELFIIIFIGAFIFFIVSQSSKKNILSIIFISIIGYYIYIYLSDLSKQRKETNISNETFFNNEILNRNEINDDNFFLKKFPKKKLKFFLKNDKLVAIAKDLVITRMFDKAKYADLLNLMNEYQKVYTYILADRYPPESYVAIFIDLGNSILENIYSIYFIVPETLRHVYGLNPYEVIENNIKIFTILNNELLNILKSFTMKQKKIPYFPDIDIVPLDKPFNYMSERKLP